jgi:hypothetical protein
MASDYLYASDATPALARSRAGDALVIPVVLHDCTWESSDFGRLAPLSGKREPISSHPNQHEAWAEVVRGLCKALGIAVVAPEPDVPRKGTPDNLPPRRQFVGRRDELVQIDDALRREGRTSITQPASLWGLGGVGKTALALEYAHRALDSGTYPGGVWWMLAEGRPLDAMVQLAVSVRRRAPRSWPTSLRTRPPRRSPMRPDTRWRP